MIGVSRTHTQTSGEDKDEFRELEATAGKDENPLSASLFLTKPPPTSIHQTLGEMSTSSFPFFPFNPPIQPPVRPPHHPLPRPPVPPPPPPPLPPPAVAMAAIPPVDKKIGTKPPAFTDPSQWENWSRLLVTFINMNKSRFLSDAKIIQFATTLMTDGWPGTWAQRFVDEVLARAATAGQPTSPEDADWGTWTPFFESLKKSFEDPNKANIAAQALDLIKQGKQTADQFFQRFDQLIKKANLTDSTTLINMLKRKLSPAVIDRIYASDSPIPTTYDTFKEAAIKHNNRIREAIHIKAVNSGTATSISYPGQTVPATSSDR